MTLHTRYRIGVLVVTAGLAISVPGGAQSPRTILDQRPFEIEVVDGYSLRSDGGGVYRDGEGGVGAFGQNSLTLCSDGRRCTTFPESAPTTATARTLVLDLNSPVQTPGATARGIRRAEKANFGAFWEQDRTARITVNGRESWAIKSPLDLPVGRTVMSERVEIRFFADGRQHILQFGPWTAGQYQANQGTLSGAGSTPASITRTSETRWVVRSGDGSLGRLWDNSDPAKPVDLGLYTFTFEVRYLALPQRAVQP
jgi:hypothetical protein